MMLTYCRLTSLSVNRNPILASLTLTAKKLIRRMMRKAAASRILFKLAGFRPRSRRMEICIGGIFRRIQRDSQTFLVVLGGSLP